MVGYGSCIVDTDSTVGIVQIVKILLIRYHTHGSWRVFCRYRIVQFLVEAIERECVPTPPSSSWLSPTQAAITREPPTKISRGDKTITTWFRLISTYPAMALSAYR